MVDEVEFMIMDSEERDEKETCEDCAFYEYGECHGKCKGTEKDYDSDICDGFKPESLHYS